MVLGRAFALAAMLVAAWRIPPIVPPESIAPPGAATPVEGSAVPPTLVAPAPRPAVAPAPAVVPVPVPMPVPMPVPVPVPPSPPVAAAPSPGADPLDLLPQVRVLARVAACAPGGEIPARFNAKVVDAHCKELAALHEQWTKRWLARARPFFDQVVPPDLPTRIVYPFGGGDLLTALVTFPKASEITTLSLEPAGDPRGIDTISAADLAANLTEVRKKVNHIFSVGHSKTTDMGKMARGKLPGNLTYSLVALALNDYDVVSARFFRLGEAGQPVYMTRQDLEGTKTGAKTGTKTGGRKSPFASLEIEYQPRAGGERRTFRHIAVNLDDTHLGADPSVLRHLEAKGQIAAMTKAASYLLWWKEFGKIRDYLLQNMVWMVSDSTGVPPDEARAAGFEQIPFGRFDGPFLGGGKRPAEVFRKMWADDAAPLAFRFGYPDIAGHDHLLITRRAAEK